MRRAARRDASPSESQIQCAFVSWCRWNEAKYPALRLAFAVPNGGLRNVITAVRLKREGARKGVPDWMLPVPLIKWGDGGVIRVGRQASGLMIEFKSDKGRLSPEQKDYHKLANTYGWRVEVCTSAEQAIKIVEDYLT